jgi:hypothetical protein
MPRISAEAKAASIFRVGGQYPKPPSGFSGAKAKMWRDIVHSKPLDWFSAGSLLLLARYCEVMARAAQVSALVAQLPADADTAAAAEKRLVALNTNAAVLATKLRLTVQDAVNRKDRKLDEAGQDGGDVHPLIGGKAEWRRAG